MIIFPAIDLKDGLPVRLYKGDFSTAEQVADSAMNTALRFESQGASWLHMVDLDGAKQGAPANDGTVLSVAADTGLRVQVGGGIRNLAAVERYLSGGIARVILGSAALNDTDFVREAVRLYGNAIAIGIDAMHRMVKTEGWCCGSEVDFITLAREMEQIGVRTLIFTDISRDGTMTGPNLTQLEEIAVAVSCDIIASGGMTTPDDLAAVAQLGLYGAICGKSLYKGTIDLAQAIQAHA